MDDDTEMIRTRIATLQSLRTAAERLGDGERIAAIDAQIAEAQAALEAAEG
jgi:hypothetical protein